MSPREPTQLGFDSLLGDADRANTDRAFARETAHLPDTMAAAIPFYRGMTLRHHAAMLAGDVAATLALRAEADRLAARLNGGLCGIIAGPDSPGRVLARETAAESMAVPLWGQEGEFMIALGDMRVRIEMHGMFGIGAGFGFWPGFGAHVVDPNRPFISETGYRSFLGIFAEAVPGLTPDAFASKIVEAHVVRELKGRLLPLDRKSRKAAA